MSQSTVIKKNKLTSGGNINIAGTEVTSIASGVTTTCDPIPMHYAKAMALFIDTLSGGTTLDISYQLLADSNLKDGNNWITPSANLAVSGISAADVYEFYPPLASYIRIVITNTGANTATFKGYLMTQEEN